MASHPLTDTQDCVEFFQSGILATLQYWGDHEAVKSLDISVLDREREGIISAISFGINLHSAWPTVRDLVIAFSPYMERRGHWRVWNTLLGRAVEVAHKMGDMAGAITLSAMFARLLQRQSRAQESIFNYRCTIQLSRQIDDRFNEARACTNLGYYFIERGHWHRAEVLCCHALKLFEQIDSKHGLAHTENHLGYLYTWQRRWLKAQRHLERACAIWETIEDNWGLMYGFMNLGVLYDEMEQPDQSRYWSEKALDQANLTGEKYEIGTIYLNIGSAHWKQGKLTEAAAYAQQAEAAFHHYSNFLGLARVWGNLGLIYLDQRNWAKAIYYMENSLEAFRKLDNSEREIKTLLDIIQYELVRKNKLQALIRLNELDNIISNITWKQDNQHLRNRLETYRRSLSEYQIGQTATVK